jgi:serine/threonine protein kinase
MPLSKGDRLGPYEILALVGLGGMGEVYRAHDDRLRRDVAIKVSNAQFTERFTIEARSIAALNHTNICHLYDVGPNYLVMEYVEGEDLKGPLDFNEALPIIQQLIDGIEAAHDKNIVHRDLKPANIKITPEGVVKILDFGLAKAMDTNPPSGSNAANSPTLTIGATAVGTILGTAGYMAPEQAKGKAADKRSDIWSFGVILFELLTGKKMFPGETAVEILGGVLNKEPDILSAPPRLHRLLLWCLEKDRKQRLASISDARRLLAADDESTAPSASGLGTEPQRQWFWMASAAVLALALAGLAFLHFRERPPEAPLINTALLPPEGGTFELANYALPAISPDGKRIAFGARSPTSKVQQLWVRRLDSATAQILPGTDAASNPFWSPDSRYVGFAQGQSLKKIDVQGGPPVTVASPVVNMRGGAWNLDGVILYATNDPVGTIYRVSSAGGTPEKASAPDASDLNGHRYPVFLPDQKHFLYTAPNTQAPFPVRVGSLDEPGKPGKEVARAYSNAMFAGGHIFYLRENTLMAQPFDADRLQTTGEALPIAEHVPSFSLPARDAAFAVSSSGLLVYQSGGDAGRTRLLWVDRSGKELSSLGEPVQTAIDLQLSPDGKTLVTALQEASQQLDLWTYDLARQVRTRFTFDPGTDRAPVYTPDGAAIVWSSNRGGKTFDLYRKASNGTSSDELLYSDLANKGPASISPDGKVLLYDGPDPGKRSGSRDVWVLPLTPERAGAGLKPHPFIQTSFDERRPQFSPDGKWVVYDSNESGQYQVYVVPYPGPGGKRQISPEPGTQARWRRDGKEIYYLSLTGEVMAAEVAVRSGALEVGKVQKLFGGLDITKSYPYIPAADGQKFIVASGLAAAPQSLTLVQNWMALLRK